MTEPDVLSAARAAIDGGDWQRALDLLDSGSPMCSTVPAFELRAQAAYANGNFEAAVSAWEDVHAARVAEGDHVDAARAAAMVAMFLLIDSGLMAAVRGWVRRAEALLQGAPESPAHALVAMVRTYERFMCGDMPAVRQHASSAIDLGTRHGVTPAVAIGRVALARLTILDGHIEDGLGQLDDVATMLSSGDVDPLTTGMMYCELICAAQGLGRYDRAIEWTDVMERWRHGAAFGAINGRCRVHRAELLRVSGPCGSAEEQALLACEELRPWMRREFGWPLVELGNIRLRKGDLVGAEEAFIAAHERAWSAQPGLALLRLAQGDVETAAAMIDDAIEHPIDLPWKERPPSGELRLAPLLDAKAEIAAAAGDVATARQAATALARIADHFPSPALRAAAQLAEARARLAGGDLASAKAAAMGALVLWADLGAPFDAAVARTVLAEARRGDRSPDAARMEWQAARGAFEAFGAAGWVVRCDRALVDHDASRLAATPGAAPIRPRDPNDAGAVFRREGDIRVVHLDGRSTSVHDLKGLRYLERLLAEPGREFHVLDLVTMEQGSQSRGSDGDFEGDVDDGRLAATGMPVLDERAREAYRRRLAEVDEDIDEATMMNDPARRELAERDRDYLLGELRRAVGLDGRERTTGGSAERARTAVTRSLRYALARLAEHHPVAAAHLEQHVRTGTYCSYAPDPVTPVHWAT
jgi:tetratricopeptide (TPR) repeat protein